MAQSRLLDEEEVAMIREVFYRVPKSVRHVDLVRGRGGDADTTEGQRDMLDLTMTNAWSATTTASTHRHRGTEELSEI